MFYSLLDIAVCPACSNSLTTLVPVEQPQRTAMRMKPALRASPPGAAVGPLFSQPTETQLWRMLSPLAALPATDGRDREVGVVQGVLVCVYCERWYPVRDGLPELLPDHVRRWDEDREWLVARQADLAAVGLAAVWEVLLAHTQPSEQTVEDEGAHYKRSEMAITRRTLPEGFFGPALVTPFNPSRPGFSLDLLARYVTTVSRLGCGLNATVFDLGVGYAWTTEWLVRLGYQAIGVDITREYILAGLPRMGNYLPHLIVGDVENLPLRDECVDAVLSFDAFHHLPNRRRAMAELARIMRAGAKMVLVEPGKEHEGHPQSVAVMQQHGILERGFDRADLAGYIRDSPLGNIFHHRTDAHPHDIFTVQKAGAFETDSRTPHALVAQIVVQPKSASAAAGSRPELTVSITNCGDTIWLNATPDGLGEVHLGANLFDPHHNLLQENYARVVLPRAVRPGQRLGLQCALPPINRPGNYVVELDMVDDGFLWFKDYSFQPVAWPLMIEGDAAEVVPDAPLVSEVAPRITPMMLVFEEKRVDVIPVSKAMRVPAAQLPRVVWEVLKSEGPVALGRKVVAYLRR